MGAIWAAKRVAARARRIEWAGKTVLITGGSRGLGLALGREFARHGAKVAFCARDAQEIVAAEADIRQHGVAARGFVCDLRNEPDIADLIDKVESALGPIEVLVNNAGTIGVGPVQNMSAQDFRQAMDVNFWPAVHTILAVAPGMGQRGGGRIVNIASIGGKMPVPHLAPYCASKFALVGLSSSLRAELASDGILVTTVSPSLMNTGSPRNAMFKGNHDAEYAWFSISDSLPGLSMSAARAARKIVAAARDGEPELLLGFPAKLAARIYGIAPGIQAELATVAVKLMPGPDGSADEAKIGHASESSLTRSFLRARGHQAEREYNQLR
jgi:NAD(P)-dependent dehydrogenase (short-subunit alcohol dehydrogenase family)